MVEKDIQFSIKDDIGNDVDCYLLASKNVSDTEINVIFRQSNDSEDTLRYGRMIMDDDGFTLTNSVSDVELDELKELLDKEIRASVARIAAFEKENA